MGPPFSGLVVELKLSCTVRALQGLLLATGSALELERKGCVILGP